MNVSSAASPSWLVTLRAGRYQTHIAVALLLALLSYAGATDLYRASRRPFWYDEICTAVVVAQGAPANIWRALEHAADTNPPLFYLLESAAKSFFRDIHVAYRVPSVIGCLIVSVALFVFVRRISGVAAGLVAAIIPLLTNLRYTFAVEARPYALVTGAVALALVLWQPRQLRSSPFLLACALSIATSLHYYAVFSLVPLGLAEATWSVRTGRIRVGVWIAFLAGVAPLVAFLPLLSSLKQVYAAGFWAQPSLLAIPKMYDHLLRLPHGWGAGLGLVVVMGMALAIARYLRNSSDDCKGIQIEECVVIIALTGLPIIAYGLVRLSGGGLTDRYVMPLLLGIASGAGYLCAKAGQRACATFILVLLIVLGIRDERAWRKVYNEPPASEKWSAVVENLKRTTNAPSVPIVVSSGLQYLPLAYYATLDGTNTLVSLADAPAALSYAKTDSVDRALSILSLYLPLNIQGFARFVELHHQFFLLSNGDDRWDWWPRRLADEHYSLKPIASVDVGTLYLVEVPDSK